MHSKAFRVSKAEANSAKIHTTSWIQKIFRRDSPEAMESKQWVYQSGRANVPGTVFTPCVKVEKLYDTQYSPLVRLLYSGMFRQGACIVDSTLDNLL
jgi:hypothetical protein